MSEEQNLLFEAAAPTPPRAKRQAKSKTAVAVGEGDTGGAAEAPAKPAKTPRAPRAKKTAATVAGAESGSAPVATERSAVAGESARAAEKAPSQEQVHRGEEREARESKAAAPNVEHRPRPAAAEGESPRTEASPRDEHRSGGQAESRRNSESSSGGNEAGAAVRENRQSESREGGEAQQARENLQGREHLQGRENRPRREHSAPPASDGSGEMVEHRPRPQATSDAPGGEHREAGEGGAEGSSGSMSKSRRRRRKRKNRAAANAAGAAPVVQDSNAGSIDAVAGQGTADAPPTREFRQHPGQGNTGHASGGNAAGQGTVVGQGFQSGSGAPVVGQGFQSGSGGGQGYSQNGQNNGQNARRNKKKKFRRAGEGEGGQNNGFQQNGPRPPRPEPGNSLQGSMGGQRRNRKGGPGSNGGGQSRGPRAFVGPMDHSYREANGNFADVPASTIQIGQRQRSGGHRHFSEDRLPPELMHNNRPVAIPEGAPTHIYFFIEDLFFTAKIQEAARQQGVKVAFMKPEKDVVAHLSELHDHEHPSLIVFDLNNVNAKPLTLIPKLKAKLKKGTSILGFLSHLQGDLKQKAVEAGCHTVMPRSAFSQNLPNLLRRYGVEDEHEPNFNQ